MGGLNWVVLPWLVLCWFVYASFFASLGLWFSARTIRTLPATVWTLSATVALAVGQLLPWLLIGLPAVFQRGDAGHQLIDVRSPIPGTFPGVWHDAAPRLWLAVVSAG